VSVVTYGFIYLAHWFSLDIVSVKFEGQGHRSDFFKVTRKKNATKVIDVLSSQGRS